MKKAIVYSLILVFALFGCQNLSLNGLNSTTYIKGKEVFLLGENEHRRFSAHLKNTSNHEIFVTQFTTTDSAPSYIVVNPNKTLSVNVEENTALKIENRSEEQVAVQLKVKGDTGLSMGYKK